MNRVLRNRLLIPMKGIRVALGLILFCAGLAFAELSKTPVVSSATAPVAHYSYPPQSRVPLWWQKTVKWIRFWAQALGAGITGPQVPL